MNIDIVDVRNRVMALCELIQLPTALPSTDPMVYTTGTAYRDESECSWKLADLPAYVVEDSGRGSEYTYTNTFPCSVITRDVIRIILYLSHIKDETYAKNLDAIDLTNRIKAAVILFFAARPTLALSDGISYVDRARILRATSPHTYATKGAESKNRVIVFNMTVDYTN